MDDLVKALEQATEGSRELDADVCKVAFWQSHGYYGETDEHGEWFLYSHRTGGNPTPKERLPHYTTSLDAALTLVPEGWRWGRDETGAMFVQEKTWPIDLPGPRMFAVDGPPTLALCTCALRARQGGE